MIRNTMMLLPILVMTMATAALTEKEWMETAEKITQIIRKNRLNKTDNMQIKVTDEQMEAMAAAIRTGDKAEQERIVREIVAAQMTQ